ncbi:MAG: hypothetical protein BWY67_00725 [Bacteroidetes bacterium ADurb.Bin397]|nr:MAG: hypothetical protein BWY67_00725 [Bacteroidetes bacterium ADurb.Bin397]
MFVESNTESVLQIVTGPVGVTTDEAIPEVTVRVSLSMILHRPCKSFPRTYKKCVPFIKHGTPMLEVILILAPGVIGY